jgi:hypothetical protein
MAAIDPEITQILQYCGFQVAAERTSIAQDGFESYDDIMLLTENDIASPAKGFAKRTNANRKIVFGLRRTNLLKATVHWVQDFRRISRDPSILDIANALSSKQLS